MAVSERAKLELRDLFSVAIASEIASILNSTSVLSSTEAGFLDSVTAGTAAASKAVVLSSGGDVTWVDGGDITLGTTTGTKIGTTTTGKLGFYNATPVVQPAHADQAAAVAASGGDSPTESEFNAVVTLVNRLRTDLIALGLIKGSA